MYNIAEIFNEWIWVIIVLIGVLILFKIAKEVVGLIIKVGIIILIIYLLYNYTGLYYYLQGILSSFGL